MPTELYIYMISILIPVYEYDVRPLILVLHGQCTALGVPFEIICMDDASTQPYRDMLLELQNLEGIKVEFLTKNIGRASIRNKLVERANYQHLLFLDADGMPETPDFISRYLTLKHKADIICGGRSYAPDPPQDEDLILHWHYGREREVSTVHARQMAGWEGFQTNNFLVNKHVFEQVTFEESIKTYGHEDTLFGLECKRVGFNIYHIDNPAIHLGLESRKQFLSKMETAILNLIKLRQAGFPLETKLSRKSEEVSNSFLFPITYFTLKSMRFLFHANNRLKKPFLTLLDIYKLYLYLTHFKTDQNATK